MAFGVAAYNRLVLTAESRPELVSVRAVGEADWRMDRPENPRLRTESGPEESEDVER